MILLDTNVVSALMRRDHDPAVVEWLDNQPAESIWTTSVTVLEVRMGLELLDPGRRRDPEHPSLRRARVEPAQPMARLGSCAGSYRRSSRRSSLVTRPRDKAYSARLTSAFQPIMLGTPALSNRVRRYSMRLTRVVRGQPSLAAAAA